MTVNRQALQAAAFARLESVAGLTAYRSTDKIDPPLVDNDPAGHVTPYAVLYPSPGTPTGEDDLADTAVDLDWLIQITASAGFQDDLDALVTRIDAAFYRWVPALDGAVCGPMKPPAGYNPGPVRLDTTVKPYRPFLPLQYRCTITTT